MTTLSAVVSIIIAACLSFAIGNAFGYNSGLVAMKSKRKVLLRRVCLDNRTMIHAATTFADVGMPADIPVLCQSGDVLELSLYHIHESE